MLRWHSFSVVLLTRDPAELNTRLVYQQHYIRHALTFTFDLKLTYNKDIDNVCQST